MPGRFLYFAYGSNLLTARLRARCPSARKLGNAFVTGHRLAWHKFGCDATGKCDLVPSSRPTDRVHGVAWSIATGERGTLDLHEELGTGYLAVTLPIRIRQRLRLARTYRAILVDPSLRPLDWYQHFVVAGAREHRLPADWIAGLQRPRSIRDNDLPRRNRNVRIGRRR